MGLDLVYVINFAVTAIAAAAVFETLSQLGN